LLIFLQVVTTRRPVIEIADNIADFIRRTKVQRKHRVLLLLKVIKASKTTPSLSRALIKKVEKALGSTWSQPFRFHDIVPFPPPVLPQDTWASQQTAIFIRKEIYDSETKLPGPRVLWIAKYALT
jgi:hypothetical protein